MGQMGFWDCEQRHTKLAEHKSLLVRLNEIIPWESFRPMLEGIYQKERKSNAGRKPCDVVLMFKLTILQRLYNIGNDELEYQVNDRLSFMRFLGLGVEDTVLDGSTVWLFRERLKEDELVEELFEKFDDYLRAEGYKARGGALLPRRLERNMTTASGFPAFAPFAAMPD